ncbi:PREDICTED: collagen alpha-1(I) chain-like [Chrysochloris asiatica]|uniref:Collagen alpha-1(I) chain-like n=1 Tax=Chrysochloris asiatica TaxID=185453 RepID=A0A9B0WI41_CHRAS|nr:PREDICTED: collagen alpha-1(I) chain-like [Chrysochloris asiatica]
MCQETIDPTDKPPILNLSLPNHSLPRPPAFVHLHPPLLLAPRTASPLPEREPPPAGRIGPPRLPPLRGSAPTPWRRRGGAVPLVPRRPPSSSRRREAGGCGGRFQSRSSPHARPSRSGRPGEARRHPQSHCGRVVAWTPTRSHPRAGGGGVWPGKGLRHVRSPAAGRFAGLPGRGVMEGGLGGAGVRKAQGNRCLTSADGINSRAAERGSPAAKSQEREREREPLAANEGRKTRSGPRRGRPTPSATGWEHLEPGSRPALPGPVSSQALMQF